MQRQNATRWLPMSRAVLGTEQKIDQMGVIAALGDNVETSEVSWLRQASWPELLISGILAASANELRSKTRV